MALQLMKGFIGMLYLKIIGKTCILKQMLTKQENTEVLLNMSGYWGYLFWCLTILIRVNNT